ncbi:hypothetical protein [Bradyrhizobium sp. 30]|nr:hypothetical protein [Bradyrhizobium sp. 30]
MTLTVSGSGCLRTTALPFLEHHLAVIGRDDDLGVRGEIGEARQGC